MIFEIDNDLKNKSGVYKITSDSLPNGIYIGSAKRLYIRFLAHRSELRRGIHHNKKIQHRYDKYNDFRFQLLSECQVSNLIELEQLILDEVHEKYNVFNVNLNCESRLGMKHSEETKNKISLKKIGVPQLALRGIKFTDERKKKLSEAHKGKPSPIKGRVRPESDRIAIINSLSKFTKEEKEERYRRISEARSKTWAINKEEYKRRRLANKPHCKWIIQCDLKGNPIKEYHGIKYAAIELGFRSTAIWRCLKGNRKTYKGFIWKYK